ncbi:hypothetical protein ABPG74_002079 [Tetrahymena malaccensis]
MDLSYTDERDQDQNMEFLDQPNDIENSQNKIQLVESELNSLLQDLEITEIEQIPQEIKEAKENIQKYKQKNQIKKASKLQERLDKLIDALKKYQELLVTKDGLLKKKLNDIFQEVDIQNEDQIESEIQEVQNDIENLKKKNQKKQLPEKQQILDKLIEAKSIVKELENLTGQIENKQNQIQEEQLQSNLNEFQPKILDAKQISDQIQRCSEEQNNSDQNQLKLEKVLETQKLQEQVSNIKNQNKPQQQIPEDYFEEKKYEIEIENQDDILNHPSYFIKKFNLDQLRKDISLIPESSEKYLLEMLEICINLKPQQNNLQAQIDQRGQQLFNQIEKIQLRLKVEDQITSEISQRIQKIKMNIEQENLEAIIDETDKIIKKIRILNINEIKRLIEEGEKAAKMIEGQEIILLLGGTGAGKSTTIHFLAGSQMGYQEIELEKGTLLKYIAPIKIKNQALQKIKVGYPAISETRFITPVIINYKDLDMTKGGSIILCDSPGFDDTAGPEVDIANGLGIVKAIQLCKSVRPVILVSYQSIGDRGQGIKQLAHILVRFVKDMQDKLSSFSYLFSKFPKNYDIQSELTNIKQSLDQGTEEKSDKAYIYLFEDIIDKAKKSWNKIDPIKGNPSDVLKALIREDGIEDPSQIFKFSITSNSQAAITNFTLKAQQLIISALNKGDYKLIEYKLDELKFLQDILNQDLTKQTYEKCINYIKEAIKKDYENATEQLAQQIQNNNKLDSNYINQYKELIQKFSSLQDLKNKHLGIQAIGATDLVDELKLAVKKLAEIFDNEDIILTALINLDNIKLIQEQFTEVKNQYCEVCTKVQNQIQKKINSCKEELQNKNFDAFAEAIFLVEQYRNQFQNHIDGKLIISKLEKIKEDFKSIIDQIVQNVNEMMKQFQLKQETVNKINEQIYLIESAEKNQLLCQYIKIEQIKIPKKNLYKNLLEYFEDSSQKIKSILTNQQAQAFQQLEGLISQMNLLRKIKGLESKTADIYHKCLQEIQAQMQQIRRDVEQLLSDFQHDKKKVDFQKIYRCLNQLKCAKWMNDIEKESYDYIIEHINQELYKYSYYEIFLKLTDLNLSCQNFGNIQVASQLLKELDDMILLEEYNTKLTELRENAFKTFKQSVQAVSDQVQEFINPQSQKFLKIDGSRVEDYLNYICACCQNKTVRTEANILLDQLKKFLLHYRESTNQQMNNNYEIVIDLKEEDERKKKQSALQLASLIQEITEIQKYEETSKLIKASQLIEDLKSRMKQYYVELNHDMNQTSIDKMQQAKNINILKLLSLIENALGETKFFEIYKQHLNALKNQFKDQYRKILDSIDKNDFRTIQSDIIAINDSPENQQAISYIQDQLQSQVENLLEQANLDALQLGNQIEKDIIVKIIKNIELVKKSKNSLKKHFEPVFQEVDKKIEQIISQISQMIQKYLESINALLKQSNFFEVEEKREHISQICQLLVGYCKDQQYNQALENLQKNLENKVTEITNINYEDEKDFILDPPKQILIKLSKVSGRNLKYAECYANLQKKVIDKVRGQIVQYYDSEQNQQNQQILKLEPLINSLPEELKQTLKDQLDSYKQQNEQKKKYFEEQLEQVRQSEDLEEKKNYLKECQNGKMPFFETKIKKTIQEDCQTLFNKFQEEMENDRLNEGIQQLMKLIKYYEYFESDDKIKNHQEKALNSVQEELKNKLKNLKCIEKCTDVNQYEQEYKFFLNILQIVKGYKNQILSTYFERNLEEFSLILEKFFVGIFQAYDLDLKNDQVENIENDLLAIKKWENFVLKIQNDFYQAQNLSSCFKQLHNTLNAIQEKNFKECMDRFANHLNQIKTGLLNFNFIQDIDKNEYYQKIQKNLKVLKQVSETKIDFKGTNFDPQCIENECIPKIKRIIEEEEKKVEEILEKDDQSLQDRDYKNINNYYENIECFYKNVKNSLIKIEKYIKYIEVKIEKKIQMIENCIDKENVVSVAQNIIQMKKHSQNLHPFKNKISNRIDTFLKTQYLKDKGTKAKNISKLAIHLQEDENGYGTAIIEESDVFKGVSISIFNETTQRHHIQYIIENIKGDELDKIRLQILYRQFEMEYQDIVQKNLILIQRDNKTDKDIVEDLVAKIKMNSNKKVKLIQGKINWDFRMRLNLPSLIAHVFALWTLLNTQYFQEVQDLQNNENYLLKPHVGQVISVFRLLGLGYEKENLYNNLVQLGTGEGKSIIIAITSIIFALHDIDIYCACYSEYLSQRDYNNFIHLFNTIGVVSNIKYGVFNNICEQIINEQGQIRDLTVNYITQGFPEISENRQKDKEIKPKILLIDEVDVFFSLDFHGKLYNPIARLQDQCISDLAVFIWNKRNNHLTLQNVKDTDIYQQCISKFKNLYCIIDEAIKDMISDSKNFQHSYIVQNHQIGYQEQDGISFNITYGYKTLFAYFYEKEKGRVSDIKLKENTFISIKCGNFSYSEIPFRFNCIAGVTGTLETLSKTEKNIVKDKYKITMDTYIPSVFGKNKCKFAKQKDVHVENQDDYFKVLREEIDKNLNLGNGNSQLRSVLVFFDSKHKLNQFYNSPELSDLKMDVQVITEELSTNSDKKQQLINKASISGQVTLLTSSFGRGTDFICRDQRVLKNGGVHVIQTFFSNKKSEEVQIIGRSARQGQVGSYSLVLLDQDLQKIIGSEYQNELESMRKQDNFYKKLDEIRKMNEDQEYKNRNKYINQIKKDHEEGQLFIKAMIEQKENFINEFLANKNKGANDIPDLIRILCLVDGTASMGPLLNKAKTTIKEMFERSCLIIKGSEKNIPEDCFQLQFAVYRDYDMKEKILEASPWEQKVDNLLTFLERIKPEGGEDYEEAVEIGLQHANQQNQNQELTAIILLADAPSKSRLQIMAYRQHFGGESYWKTTKYSQITDYQEEIKKLQKCNIPIHCFYLHEGAKSNFNEIAEFTGGKSEYLNINDKEASNTLIKVVVEPILKNVGKQNGLGDYLYSEYLKMFDKSYK